jgi:hypothetical protein
LDDDVALGVGFPEVPVDGALRLYGVDAVAGDQGGETIRLTGNNSTLRTFSDEGLLTAKLGKSDFGDLRLRDAADGGSNDETVWLTATASSGGQLVLGDANGVSRVIADGGSGAVLTDGSFVASFPGTAVIAASLNGDASGGRLELDNVTGANATVFGVHETNGGGFAQLYQTGGTLGIEALGDAASGASLKMHANNGDVTVELLSHGGGGGASFDLKNGSGATTIFADGDDNNAGSLSISNNVGTETAQVRGGTGGHGAIALFKNGSETNTIVLNADDGDAGKVSIHDAAGIQTVLVEGAGGAVGALESLEVVDGWGSFVLAQIFKDGGNGWFESFASDGERTSKLGGGLNAGGRLLLYDAAGSVTVLADGDDGDGSGALEVRADNGSAKVILDAERTGADDGGSVVVIGNDGSRIKLHGSYEGTGNTGAWIEMRDGNTATSPRIVLEARNTDGGAGGRIRANNDAGDNTVDLVGDIGGDGFVFVRNDVGTATATIVGDNGTNGGAVWLRNSLAETTATLSAGNNAGTLRLYDHTTETVVLAANSTYGGLFEMNMSDGTETIELVADVAGAGDGSILRMRDSSGTNNIVLDGRTGWTSTRVLEITGGSDLSERFDISAAQGSPRPGMVVSIDPHNPGKLVASSTRYDRKVAGIISGAGGVSPGMTMGQSGTIADGAHPVALSGRVYCYADARDGAIVPGDLLTTSSLAGHAMRVSYHTRSAGAVIGKAMTGLDAGQTGLVLVLVNLQ